MKNSIRKLCKVIAIALLCITITTPVLYTSFAMETQETGNIKKLLETEGFKQINLSEIPEGVTPIVVDSEEELQNELEKFENEISTMNKPVLYDLSQVDNTNPFLKAIRYKDFHVTKKISFTTHNLFGTLKIDGNNIISVHNLKQDWTGYSLGTDYQDHPAKKITYSISSNKQTATITAPYKVNLYIFVEGIGQVTSRYGSTTFTVNK